MKQRYLLTVACLFISLFIFAQETITISGNVQDEKKEPLIGATVTVKGNNQVGAVTDASGNYSLQVPKTAKTLVINYVGYEPREIAIDTTKGNYVVNIDMATAATEMNQVIVSASKKSEKILDAPASVSVLGQDKIERNIVTTPVEQLKTTPGVDVMRTGLVSSNIVIRGFNNIFSGSVLNVVDNRIGAVPSLRVNAYQLVPVSNLDYEKIEVVRGPASALYGPNASSGVVHIMTKSPLDQKDKFMTTVAMTSGFTVLDKSYKGFNNGSVISGNIINPELRHSGKLWDGKFGYKLSGSYFQGQDYPNYDRREPYDGDSILFGYERNGVAFKPDTLGYVVIRDSLGVATDTVPQLDVRRFKKDFAIRKYTADVRLDFKPIEDIQLTINGGVAGARNIELTGLGAAAAGGPRGAWIYWYFQTRFKWKNLYVQYFINSSNAGNTFLIPQLSPSARTDYHSSSPPDPYPIRRLVDRSKIHVVQIQHSVNPLQQLSFIYGFDALMTRPDTKGTINGRFETRDNLNQLGGYVQGEYEPLKWFKLVAACRVDYNSIIKNAAVSPRAAVVFKPAVGHNVRLTYNRAFDSPTTLNQFLDLSNGVIPNGINVRGIGNPYGWTYNFDEGTGTVQWRTAPWGGNRDSTRWVTFGDNSYNIQAFDSLKNFVINTFTNNLNQTPGSDPMVNYLTARGIVNAIFNGISGQGGSVTGARQMSVDYANFATTKDLPASIQNANNFQNLKKINNSFTQTIELGYKGFLFNKLSLQIDAYWTRVSNYVSALRAASGAVMLDHASYLGDENGGRLYDNLYANDSLRNKALLGALDGATSLQNPSIIQPIAGSVLDELIVMTYQFPMGTITPNDPELIGSDFILTYKNVGRLDVFGIDFGFQYNAYDDDRHSVVAGGSLSWVDKDQFTLTSGEIIHLNAPKIKTAVTFDHALKRSGFGYGLTFRYQHKYYANSSVYEGPVKEAYLLDARLSWKAPFYKKGLMLSINVNNVTNYQWRSFPGTPLTGAQFFARAQVTF